MEENNSFDDKKRELAQITKHLSKKKFPWIVFILMASAFFALFFYSVNLVDRPKTPEEIYTELLMIFFVSIFYATLFIGGFYLFEVNKLEKKRHKILVEYMSQETENLQGNLDENFFTNLVKINFKYIDKYYLQTQIQADKSFTLTAYAAVSGLIVIIIGLTLLFFKQIEVGYVTTATGLLGEFIASIFFYLYNNTVSKMSDYHQKLVLTQNISLALKIADDLPDNKKAKAKAKLVKYLSKNVNQLLVSNKDNNIFE